MKRFLAILGMIGITGLATACDSSSQIATATARAAGTNTINLTLTAVLTPPPIGGGGGAAAPATPVPVGTQAGTQVATMAATVFPAPVTQVPPSAAVTIVGTRLNNTLQPSVGTAQATQAATGAATQSAPPAVSTQAATASVTRVAAAPTVAGGGPSATPFNPIMATVFTSRTQTAVAPTATPTATLVKNEDLAWFDTATIYSLYVRSFRDSNGDGIGDLRGVIDGLDYLQTLGVDTIWLLPVFKSPSVHGYDTVDYYSVNPDYGTNDDLLRLISEVHKRKMYILLDYVVNHVSNQHAIFKDAFNNPTSQYSDYFTWINAAHTQYTTFAGVQEMPKLNYANPAVVKFSTDIALHWLDPNKDGDTSDGVDGFRCDVANGPPGSFWGQLRAAMNQINRKAILLGELFVQTPQDMNNYVGNGRLDAAFDFPLYIQMAGHWDRNGEGVFSGKGNPGVAFSIAHNTETIYPPGAKMVRFINNHDTNRVMSNVGGDVQRAKAAAVFLYTNPGPIVIYYGEELGMKGDKCGPPAYDACRREPLDWYKSMKGAGQTRWFTFNNKPDDGISVEEQENDGASMLSFYRKLAQVRSWGYANGADKGSSEGHLYRFEVGWNTAPSPFAASFVAINFGPNPQPVTFPAYCLYEWASSGLRRADPSSDTQPVPLNASAFYVGKGSQAVCAP
jgi:alpha-amylase